MRVVSGLLLLVCVAAPASAFAYSWSPNAIPNGTTYNCTTCHLRPTGGAGWNDFGNEIRTLRALNFGGRTIDWAALYDLDSDGDGFTNGEELGDPDGDRTPLPGFAATRPGDATSFPVPCGNAALDEGEACDGALFVDDATCESLGFSGGALGCSATCEVDDSACVTEAPDAGGGDDAGSGSDAGGGDDAGEDAGGGEDAGAPDVGTADSGAGDDVATSQDSFTGDETGVASDSGAGGPGEPDGGVTADASGGDGTPDSDVGDDSGCSATSSGSGPGGWLAMMGIGALLIRRRRS
jgi:MYXO-CTERM domain-containing protein